MNNLTGSARAKVLPEIFSYRDIISRVIVSGSFSAKFKSAKFGNKFDFDIIITSPLV